jgi:hypothetical protein
MRAIPGSSGTCWCDKPPPSFRGARLRANPESSNPSKRLDSGFAPSGRALRGPVGAPRNDDTSQDCRADERKRNPPFAGNAAQDAALLRPTRYPSLRAKRGNPEAAQRTGLLRRFAPRNDRPARRPKCLTCAASGVTRARAAAASESPESVAVVVRAAALPTHRARTC